MLGGTYTVVSELPTPTTIAVGALGEHRFPAGGYAYTGSALGSGGFSRVDRHRRVAAGDHDVRHWHVDYFLGDPAVCLRSVVTVDGVDVECDVARRLGVGPLPGFGSSDCSCESHLARRESADGMLAAVRAAYEDVDARA